MIGKIGHHDANYSTFAETVVKLMLGIYRGEGGIQ